TPSRASSIPGMKSKPLWGDVNHGGHSGAAHLRGGGRKQSRRSAGDPPRPAAFRDQLRAGTAAPAQQRRRAEQIGFFAAQPRSDLLEEALCIAQLGARGDDPHEVAKRRISELATTFELPVPEAADGMRARAG